MRNTIDTLKALDVREYAGFLDDFMQQEDLNYKYSISSNVKTIDMTGGVANLDTQPGATNTEFVQSYVQLLSLDKNPVIEARIQLDNTSNQNTSVMLHRNSNDYAAVRINSSGEIELVTVKGGSSTTYSTDETYTVGDWITLTLVAGYNGIVRALVDGKVVAQSVKDSLDNSLLYAYRVEVEDTTASQHVLNLDYLMVRQDR